MFIIWHIAEAYIEPPANLPDLYTVINVLISCGLFTLLLGYYVYRQVTVTPFISAVNSPKPKTQ
jgi:alpha-1,3-glucosyltransferase